MIHHSMGNVCGHAFASTVVCGTLYSMEQKINIHFASTEVFM